MTVERHGRSYCAQHDPERIFARQQAKDEAKRLKWEAEKEAAARRERAQSRGRLAVELADLVLEIGPLSKAHQVAMAKACEIKETLK